MPRVFRAMARDGDTPLIGTTGNALGVRVAPHPCQADPCYDDVHPDGERVVSAVSGAHPGRGEAKAEGMSVQPAWRAIPYFVLPSRFQALGLVKKARGGNHLFCWEMGDGPFAGAEIRDGLRLHPDAGKDNPTHGVIAPAEPMHIDDYQRRLAATRSAWKIIPEDPQR